MAAAAEQGVEGEQPLEVGADIELVGDAHGAVKLHGLFGHEPRAFAYLGLGAGSGALFQLAFLTNGYGLPVVGPTLGLALGGIRLPFSLRR